MIETISLSKRYGTHMAVENLNLSVPPGQIVGFLGPNGAGKSTTMNMLTGYLTPSEGEVLINGISMRKDPSTAKRHIGYLPEQPPLYQEMKAEEYLRFAAELKKLPADQRAAQVEAVIALTGIESVRNRLIRSCSKGYRQRIGLAQALLGMPDILILDEPMVGLDPKQMGEMRRLLQSLAPQHTIFISSHLLSEISSLADRILILHEGRLAADDTPAVLEQRLTREQALHLQVKGSLDQLQKALKPLKLPDFSAELHDTSVSFTLPMSADQDPREAIFYALAKAKLPLLEMTISQHSLEDVFLELTRSPEPEVMATEEENDNEGDN